MLTFLFVCFCIDLLFVKVQYFTIESNIKIFGFDFSDLNRDEYVWVTKKTDVWMYEWMIMQLGKIVQNNEYQMLRWRKVASIPTHDMTLCELIANKYKWRRHKNFNTRSSTTESHSYNLQNKYRSFVTFKASLIKSWLVFVTQFHIKSYDYVRTQNKIVDYFI